MNYTPEEQNLIVLASFEVITSSPKRATEALKCFTEGDAQSEQNLIKSCPEGVYNKVRDRFFNPKYREAVFRELEKRGVECVTVRSANYPEYLRQIEDKPPVLFLLGNAKLLQNPCLGIVGSRVTTTAAIAQCKKFSTELGKRFSIVSGSAYGADSAALEGAGDAAVSVLAYGFDCIDRCSNGRLVRQVEDRGLILSEYFPTVTPKTHYFPVRNRIIAGLSRGVLVVSAGLKSGALITADYAVEYGRELFAFPYSLGVGSGEGCNGLIKEGAALVQSPEDILQVFGYKMESAPKVNLNEDERRVYAIIRRMGEAFVPDVADELGVQPFKLIPALSSLEIKGLVIRLGGNRYGAV